MNWFDRLLAGIVQARGFVLGKGVVEHADMAWGKLSNEFTPPEYGDYIATSNNIYVCSQLRANLLRSLPVKAYRQGRGKRKVELDDRHPLVSLLGKVNKFWTFDRLMVMTELSLCLWGEAFWFLERGESGKLEPREIWWGRPDRVRVIPHPTDYLSGFLYEPVNGSAMIPFWPEEVIWFRYPNPLDEYAGLSPLAAARLAADYASAAANSNMRLHDQGLTGGGVVMPEKGVLQKETAQELSILVNRRLSGKEKEKRWAIFTDRYEFLPITAITPREAQFVEGLAWSLEEIARAYGVPVDMVGGQRTYENVAAAERAVWTRTIIPEAFFIAAELTEQLAPMFTGVDLIEFDASKVSPLQEDENSAWAREKEKITTGVQTINEWREGKGLERFPWGDVWWAPAGLLPVTDGEEGAAATEQPDEDTERGRAFSRQSVPEFGSQRHVAMMRQFDRRMEKHVRAWRETVRELLARQQESVLSKLKRGRGPEDMAANPFDMAQWVKTFRVAIRPILTELLGDAGAMALEDLGLELAFDVLNPGVQRFIERMAQRFAQQVNETTWNNLKDTLSSGVAKGESIDELAQRVLIEMGNRIRSSAETIARTEVLRGFNGATLLGWKQSGVVTGKSWLATIGDDRTRESHRQAHGQTVALDADFEVGSGSGPHPGAIGRADEDINCRCTMTAVLS